MEEQINYNEEPVYYCKHCLSLRIRGARSMDGINYCDDCGSTDIAEDSIYNWEDVYKKRYGHKYLDNY